MSHSATQKRSVSRKHDWVDERSRALHAAIAKKIRQEPALLAIACTNLKRWKKTCSDNVRPLLVEWETLIEDWPLEKLLNFLAERSERANQLRQSSPFAGILSPLERNRIFAEYEAL